MGDPAATPNATLIDARGPRRARWLHVVVGCALLVVATAASSFPSTALLAGIVAIAVMVLAAGRYLKPRSARRHVSLAFGDGALGLRGAGLFGGTLRARDVTGATAARSANGVVLVLQVNGRPEPIGIEVGDLATLQRMRRALGIGPRGRGRLTFTARAGAAQRVEAMLRLLLVATIGTIYVAALADARVLAGLATLIAMVVAPLSLVAAAVRFATPGPMLRLDDQSILLPPPQRYGMLPYASIVEIVATGRGFNVRLEGKGGLYVVPIEAAPTHLVPEGMGLDAKDLVRCIVVDAAARARGEAVSLDASSEVATLLARRAGELAAAWLARVDALAATRNAAYRGAALSDAALIEALEDHDQAPEVRAGAARVLRHAGDAARVRIAPLLAQEHEPKVKLRIAAAVEGRDEELVEGLDEDWIPKRARR